MKKLRFLSFVFALFMNAHLLAQTCPTSVPVFGTVFSTQGKIDSFPMLYPECIEMQDVQITGGDIVNLQGLNGVVAIGSLTIDNTPSALTNLEGLNNLVSLNNLIVRSNTGLVNLQGLESLQSLESFNLGSNLSLTTLTGLENLTVVNGQFNIVGNFSLLTLDGLENLTLANDYLIIKDNPALTSISSLSGLTSVGNVLLIENTGLENINGLENLTMIGNALIIRDNWALTDINSLNHTMTINNILEIRDNVALPDCVVQAVCDYINYVQDSANFQVNNNTGNCATVSTVEAACLAVGTTDLDAADVQIAPNPTTGLITLTGFEGQIGEIEVVGAAGGQVLLQKQTPGMNGIDLGALPAGVYFITIAVDGQSIVKRVVKI